MDNEPYVNLNPIDLNITARDGWQANNGTKVKAEEMTAAYANVGNYGVKSVQILGGTYTDLPIKYGRDPEEFAKKIGDHYKEQGIEERSALWRGECGTSYSRQPADVLRANIKMHLEAGANVFENFHAMNDINMMRSIPAMVKEESEALGVDAKVKGTITIQENPDTLDRKDDIIEELREFAHDLIDTGHEDFYIKNANGVMKSPEFITDIVQMLKDEFPDQKIGFHMHNTYGHAPKIYNAAIKAGVDSVDVLPDALAEGTGQPGISSIMHAIKHSDDDAISSRMPVGIKMDEMAKDKAKQYYTRTKYSDTEMVFHQKNLETAEAAGSAGGAIAALKGIPGLVDRLSRVLDTDNWSNIQKSVYEQKAENRSALGYPTNVTPHELMQDIQAAVDVATIKEGGKTFDNIAPGTIEYLSGQLGRVSPTADPEIQNRAVKQAIATMGAEIERMSPDDHGFEAKKSMHEDLISSDKSYEEGGLKKAIEYPVNLPNVEELEPGLPISRAELIGKGVENPTDKQVLIAAISKEGVEFVKGNIKPLQDPVMPRLVQENGDLHSVAPQMYEVAYNAVELNKVKIGFYEGVNGQEERISDLKENISSGVDTVTQILKEQGAIQPVVEKAMGQMRRFAGIMGGDTHDVPSIDIGEFPKHDKFSNKGNDFKSAFIAIDGPGIESGPSITDTWNKSGNEPKEPSTKYHSVHLDSSGPSPDDALN